jgi:hypothetical protein
MIMLTKFALIIGLMLPGFSEPKFQRTEIPTIEECLSKAKEALEATKTHEGEEYIFSAACFVTGAKANPA